MTGPDEYTALVSNNVFTNLMAARNLRAGAEIANRWPERAVELGVDEREIASWREAAGAMTVPFDEELGITSQSEGFTRYRKWDFAGTRPDQYPLLIHFPYYLLYSSQVVKQADLVFALYLCGDEFDAGAEAARLRLLRGDHGARLIPVSVHPSDRGGRSRASRPRP